MTTDTLVDMALKQQAAERREKALALIRKTGRQSWLSLQLPVWLALAVVILIAFVPLAKPDKVPYVALVLGFAIALVAGITVQLHRRLDAVVRLLTEDVPAD